MTIGLTGATGLIGRRFLDVALRRGHEVVAFTRCPTERAIPGCEMRAFSLATPPDLTGCEALVHLAGEPIAGLWTPGKKRRIRESRVLGTRRIVEAIHAAGTPPEVFICGSAIGIYADGGERELSEDAPHASSFLAAVVEAWEAEARECASPSTRVVHLRTAHVLARDAGLLGAFAPAWRLGLGPQLGGGRQWMPWIHVEDQARLILFAIENLEVAGPLNAAAPWPARNADFTRALAGALHRPAFLRLPAVAVRLGGELAAQMLASQRVVPAAATAYGFSFRFPELGPALHDLYG